MNNLVFIKDLKIYGNIINAWTVFNEQGISTTNYIIKDFIGIEHERFDYEIEEVNNIEDSIKQAKCNMPLEKLLELFNDIDKRYTLYIELSQKKENCHSDILVPYLFIRYGTKDKTCFIKEGKLIEESMTYLAEDNEYECCVFYYDTDIKDAIFEMYMNIITKLQKD